MELQAEPEQQKTILPTASPNPLVRSRPKTEVGALFAQEFLPTTQNTAPLTWPKGYRMQWKGRETDVLVRFHRNCLLEKLVNWDLGPKHRLMLPAAHRERPAHTEVITRRDKLTHPRGVLTQWTLVTARNRHWEWSLAMA